MNAATRKPRLSLADAMANKVKENVEANNQNEVATGEQSSTLPPPVVDPVTHTASTPPVEPVSEPVTEDKPKRTYAPQQVGEAVRMKGTPIPGGRLNTREEKYPWSTLEAPEGEGDDVVYDCFFIAGGKAETFHTLTATRNKNEKAKAAKEKGYVAKQYIAKKFKTSEGAEGVMVWRIA